VLSNRGEHLALSCTELDALWNLNVMPVRWSPRPLWARSHGKRFVVFHAHSNRHVVILDELLDPLGDAPAFLLDCRNFAGACVKLLLNQLRRAVHCGSDSGRHCGFVDVGLRGEVLGVYLDDELHKRLHSGRQPRDLFLVMATSTAGWRRGDVASGGVSFCPSATPLRIFERADLRLGLLR
jgi:hypothetical protein